MMPPLSIELGRRLAFRVAFCLRLRGQLAAVIKNRMQAVTRMPKASMSRSNQLMAVSISPLAPGSDSPKIGHGAGTKSLCRYKVPRDA